jgi:hypothetical protein
VSIETFHGGVPAVLQPAALPDGIATLRAWAGVASEAAQLVSPLINTAFVPEVFRPRIDPRATDEEKRAAHETAVATATAAVLYGAGLGLDPLQSLSSIHVVKGKPGLYAETMVALLKGAGHEVGVEDESDVRVRVWGRRKGSQTIERAEFTIERARKAGYVAQNKKYDTDPRAMLYARAVSILCRRLAPEVLKGIGSVEEVQDEPPQDGAAQPRTRTVQRAPQRAAVTAGPAAAPAASGPLLPGEEDATGPIDGGAVGIDEGTWRRINERFRELGVVGDGQTASRLTVIRTIVDRTIGRGSELTSAEGATVLDNLAGETGERLVAQVLGWATGDEQVPAAPAAPDPLDVVADEAGEDFDPTAEAGWGEAR